VKTSTRSLPKAAAAASPTLPVLDVGVERPERADATRNRSRVLNAARKLFQERSIPDVSMEDIARAAGVGKGTLYRRYPDKGSIAFALLDHDERELQERILSTEPPLGSAVSAGDRLAAFIDAYVAFVRGSMTLLLVAEGTPRARLQTGANRFWRLHCATLLRQCGTERPEFVADVLMAAMTAEQIAAWLDDDAVDNDDIAASIMATVVQPHVQH
jgi:AcrR family transcriptional regulator